MNSPQNELKLLIADDEADIGEIIEVVADSMGFDVKYTDKGSQVIRLANSFDPHVIALDLRMPDADGVEIIRELAKSGSDAAIILMSGMDQRTLTSVQKLGVDSDLNVMCTLAKPMSVKEIEVALEQCIEAKKSQANESAAQYENNNTNYGLQLFFQPEIVLKSDKKTTNERYFIETLWRMDNGILLSGNQYSDWTDKTGSSKGLTFLALEQTIAQFRKKLPESARNELVIKLGRASSKDLDLPDYFAQQAAEQNINPRGIIFEIDEDVIFTDEENVIDVLSRLRIKGFRVAIAVRAEGEQILPILDRMPVDILTIDISYVQQSMQKTVDMEVEFMYSSMASLATHKGVEVCACEVNTNAQLEFVRKCNFTSARGKQIKSLLQASELDTQTCSLSTSA